MALVIINMRVMPKSPEVDLEIIKKEAKEKIISFTEADTENIKVEINPVAFGLMALDFTFAYDESKGGTDSIEEDIKQIENVQSAEVTGVSRALG